MYKVHQKSIYNLHRSHYFVNTFFGHNNQDGKKVHKTSINKYPQVALKLPTNMININEAEMGRFSPLRERDITGPVINVLSKRNDSPTIDITSQCDPYAYKYDCRGAVSLSSSMQSNVPNPFSGNHTHLNMPGSQWGQGYKYLSDNLHSAHYLTLRNEIRKKQFNKVIAISTRKMSTETDSSLSAKDKLKRAVKEYGSTVIIFHVTISLLSLGGCYILVSSGVDVTALLKYFNMTEGPLSTAVASNTGTFVIAYGIHKIFAPARIAVTLTATPFIVRYLRNIGFLKHGGGVK
ncbi:hypothetical protein KGM_214210 [Danaus plexippus plexippus]|uniref:Uncharacterized protein n=1 Tax=Danaus plexippus plexippus TaxID=278856 RepID=A0A212ETW4_DANPL|nr:hypothetical protein KGM_214210 [Danaus plexippus plexippus]